MNTKQGYFSAKTAISYLIWAACVAMLLAFTSGYGDGWGNMVQAVIWCMVALGSLCSLLVTLLVAAVVIADDGKERAKSAEALRKIIAPLYNRPVWMKSISLIQLAALFLLLAYAGMIFTALGYALSQALTRFTIQLAGSTIERYDREQAEAEA